MKAKNNLILVKGAKKKRKKIPKLRERGLREKKNQK